MILHESRLIFVHIIKTGGTSIETVFKQPPSDHRTVKDYISILGEDLYKQYFSFTIVRNPWDKMVSQYHFNAKKWVPECTTFREYIRLFGGGRQISRYSPLHFPYLKNKHGEISVDYVGKFENLQGSFNHICKESGLNIMSLPHEKKPGRIHYRDYYDEESKNIVGNMFEEEIDYFKYKY